MTCTQECCAGADVCRQKVWYFFIVLMMLAYGIGTMFIPYDFPAKLHMFEGFKLIALIFSLMFMAANAVAAWAITRGYNRLIGEAPEGSTYYLEKIRNSWIAGLGFALVIRFMIMLVWMIKVSS